MVEEVVHVFYFIGVGCGFHGVVGSGCGGSGRSGSTAVMIVGERGITTSTTAFP